MIVACPLCASSDDAPSLEMVQQGGADHMMIEAVEGRKLAARRHPKMAAAGLSLKLSQER
jgi:hypothetical protein